MKMKNIYDEKWVWSSSLPEKKPFHFMSESQIECYDFRQQDGHENCKSVFLECDGKIKEFYIESLEGDCLINLRGK